MCHESSEKGYIFLPFFHTVVRKCCWFPSSSSLPNYFSQLGVNTYYFQLESRDTKIFWPLLYCNNILLSWFLGLNFCFTLWTWKTGLLWELCTYGCEMVGLFFVYSAMKHWIWQKFLFFATEFLRSKGRGENETKWYEMG